MKKILIGLIIVLMLYGCAEEAPQIEAPDEDMQEATTTTITEKPDAGMQEDVAKEPVLPTEKECANFDIPSQNIGSIDLTIFTEGLEKTEEGFKFRLIPMDNEGNIIPVTGNLKVSLWSTIGEEERSLRKTEIYVASFYIKEENVVEDCSSKEIEIEFERVKAARRYSSVPEDDPGIIRFEFTRTGSQDLFEKEYIAAEFDKRVFP